MESRSGTSARKTIRCRALSRENWVAFSLLIAKNLRNFFNYPCDRQMTEIFVSGTEVFSDAKMTETPYE